MAQTHPGKTPACLFAAHGAHVFGLDRNPSPERGDNPSHLIADVTDAEAIGVAAWFASQPDPETARRAQTELLPPKRIGTPEEVAHTALFLASDDRVSARQ